MTITHDLSHQEDLFGSAIGAPRYATRPNWNTYSFARLDIWAQRRIADEVLFNKAEWQQDFQLWEMNGILIGAVFFESPSDAALIGDPAHRLISPCSIGPKVVITKADPLMIEALKQRRALRSDEIAWLHALSGSFIRRHSRSIRTDRTGEPAAGLQHQADRDGGRPPTVSRRRTVVFHRSATVEQDEF
jgi:hypothetical protein